MLESLSIRNYVLIDKLDLEFGDGFSAITGETGSGKSILLGALSLILGAKADKESIRKGEDSTEVAAVFLSSSPAVTSWLDAHDAIGDDGEIIIRRSIRMSGRSSYTVNGIPVSRKEGEELGSLLVDISSQHAHQSLLRPGVYVSMVDEAAGNGELADEYRRIYSELRDLSAERERIAVEIARSAEEKDYITYCLGELDSADLKIGEEESIRARLDVINSAESLRESMQIAMDELKNGTSALSEALSVLFKAGRKDQELQQLAQRLEPVSIDADDILLTLRSHLSAVEYSEEELDSLNARLSVIQKMKRRFGGSVESAIAKRDEYKERLCVIDDGDDMLADLDKRISKLRIKLDSSADALSASRKETASDLGMRIERTLHDLGMAGAAFRITVEHASPGPDGADSISFLIAPNKGEKLSPVQNTASGGELSRILLAIKASTGEQGGPETMLFDEIDAGLGGNSANAVGDELRKLSENCQIIAITHLPQIAVRADSHYLVEKRATEGRTVSSVRKIDGEDREKETARLLSGSTSGISLEHARSLLEVQH